MAGTCGEWDAAQGCRFVRHMGTEWDTAEAEGPVSNPAFAPCVVRPRLPRGGVGDGHNRRGFAIISLSWDASRNSQHPDTPYMYGTGTGTGTAVP